MVEIARRAAPLPPDERRAAILAATVPLLRIHGMDVTTRQIAQAAGVAEGTLFRVFPDKDTLVRAAVAHALAPGKLLADLATVPRSLPLDERLLMITTMLQERLSSVIGLMMAMRMQRPPEDDPDCRSTAEPARPRHEAALEAVADLLEPDRDQLNFAPIEVARLLRLLTFSASHPAINDGHRLRPGDIVSVLLDGVRRRDLI